MNDDAMDVGVCRWVRCVRRCPKRSTFKSSTASSPTCGSPPCCPPTSGRSFQQPQGHRRPSHGPQRPRVRHPRPPPRKQPRALALETGGPATAPQGPHLSRVQQVQQQQQHRRRRLVEVRSLLEARAVRVQPGRLTLHLQEPRAQAVHQRRLGQVPAEARAGRRAVRVRALGQGWCKWCRRGCG